MNSLDGSRSWILLTECIPENSGIYIVTYENRLGFHTDVAIYNSVSGRWFWDEDEERIVAHKILAWQELPKPYQVDVKVNHENIYYFEERRKTR